MSAVEDALAFHRPSVTESIKTQSSSHFIIFHKISIFKEKQVRFTTSQFKYLSWTHKNQVSKIINSPQGLGRLRTSYAGFFDKTFQEYFPHNLKTKNHIQVKPKPLES
jgi:hypothetical protein